MSSGYPEFTFSETSTTYKFQRVLSNPNSTVEVILSKVSDLDHIIGVLIPVGPLFCVHFTPYSLVFQFYEKDLLVGAQSNHHQA